MPAKYVVCDPGYKMLCPYFQVGAGVSLLTLRFRVTMARGVGRSNTSLADLVLWLITRHLLLLVSLAW